MSTLDELEADRRAFAEQAARHDAAVRSGHALRIGATARALVDMRERHGRTGRYTLRGPA